MLWSEPTNHETDCYFCLADVKGMNKRLPPQWKYPEVDSARQPQPHSDQVPVPVYRETQAETPSKFDQRELNELVRDLGLSEEYAELLASRLKDKNCLDEGPE